MGDGCEVKEQLAFICVVFLYRVVHEGSWEVWKVLLCACLFFTNVFVVINPKIFTSPPAMRLKRGSKGAPTRRQPVRCLCTPHRQTLFGVGWRRVQPRLF